MVLYMAPAPRERGPWSDATARTIRAERAAAGMSQADVIRETGFSRSTYLRLESGERVADVSQIASLAQAFGLSMQAFVGRIEERVNADPIPPGEFTKESVALAADKDD